MESLQLNEINALVCVTHIVIDRTDLMRFEEKEMQNQPRSTPSFF
jgi:hypothetical protein